MISTPQLRRTLGVTDLTLIAMGTVIGSGIFLVPGVVLRETGMHVGLAMVVWFVAGILSYLGALTYAEMGAMKPDAGGLYAYIRDSFGPLPAFLYGWTSFFVIASGSVATLAVAFSGYFSQLIPISAAAAKVVSLVMVLTIALINVRGTGTSSTVQNWTTGAKLLGLVVFSLVLIVFGRGAPPDSIAAPPSWPEALTPALISGIGIAMIAVLWAYEGWQYLTFSAGETVNPQRTFPRAIMLATASLIGLYMIANIGYLAALGARAVSASDHVAADAGVVVLGPIAGRAISVLILISIFSAANGLMLTAPRLYFSMAADGLFFKRLAIISPRFGTPAFAVVALAAWSILLALTGTFEQLLTYVVFTGWIFYALGALSVFVYRSREPHAIRPFRVPGYPVTPALFVIAAAALVINTIVTQPARAAAGIAMVFIGVPAYLAWKNRSQAPTLPTAARNEDRDGR